MRPSRKTFVASARTRACVEKEREDLFFSLRSEDKTRTSARVTILSAEKEKEGEQYSLDTLRYVLYVRMVWGDVRVVNW